MIARWSIHGGRLADARAAYGGGPWLDLSTGINPHPWPGTAAVPIDWHVLPDEAARADLEAAAAAYLGVDPTYVCAVPGSEIGLRLLGLLTPGSAAHVEPGYRTHGEMHHDSVAVSRDALPDYGTATIVLANPGNPDGRVTDVATLLKAGRRVIVDEAFADTLPEISVAAQVDDASGLIVVRSFGKMFGLAGVRLGFVVAPRPVIGKLHAMLGSWPVSAAAIAIGAAAYRDHAWIAQMRQRLPVEAATLDGVLRRHGLQVTGGCPLFRLIETDDAAALFDRLARRAILTRPFDHDPRWLRIGLPGSATGLDRLDRALGDG